MLVCYRMAPLSYFFISRMLRVPYFSLPNLLAGEALVEELVQEQVSEAALVERATRLLAVTGQDSLLQTYRDIHLQLRQDASQKAAEAVLGIL
jgi:lipid-A-disaccharide synthase